MENQKLSLEELKVESFVVDVDESKDKLKGGSTPVCISISLIALTWPSPAR